MNLPLEIEERILLFVSSPDILNLFLTSSSYYHICSNYFFWKERFIREDLPLFFLSKLAKNATPAQYFKCYIHSRDLLEKVNTYLHTCQELFEKTGRISFISISPLTTPELLTVKEVDKEVVKGYYEEVVKNYEFIESLNSLSCTLQERIREARNIYNKGDTKKLYNLWEMLSTEWIDRSEVFLDLFVIDSEEGGTVIEYEIAGAKINKSYSTIISYESLKELLFRIFSVEKQ